MEKLRQLLIPILYPNAPKRMVKTCRRIEGDD